MVSPLAPRRYPANALAVVGGSCLALTALLTVIVVAADGSVLRPIGRSWSELFGDHWSQLWLRLSLVLDWLGYTGIFVYQGLLVLLLWHHWRRFAFFVAASTLTVLLVSRAMKFLIGRPRPADALLATASPSFPSGHTTVTVAAVVATGYLVSRTWVWILGRCVAVLVMLSRTYPHMHWLGDTVAGLFLAAGIVTLLWVLFQPRPTGSPRRQPLRH